MRVVTIDHVNISGTRELVEKCRTFYTDILGLRDGYRPPFKSTGFWLYAGETAIVHLTEKTPRASTGTGPLDHFAFSCEGLREMLERLETRGVKYSMTEVPESRTTQIFVQDPAGIALELNFPAM